MDINVMDIITFKNDTFPLPNQQYSRLNSWESTFTPGVSMAPRERHQPEWTFRWDYKGAGGYYLSHIRIKFRWATSGYALEIVDCWAACPDPDLNRSNEGVIEDFKKFLLSSTISTNQYLSAQHIVRLIEHYNTAPAD